MIKYSFLLALLLPICLTAQVGAPFPFMETESLTEEELVIPEDLNGKYSIIGLAYSRRAEDHLKTWFSPAYNQFMREPAEGDIFATEYDINLYFVPMVTGHKTVAYGGVMNEVKATVDADLHPNILFYKGNLRDYKNALGLSNNLPFFFLLNESGTIVWSTSGAFSSQKMQELVDHLDEALGNW